MSTKKIIINEILWNTGLIIFGFFLVLLATMWNNNEVPADGVLLDLVQCPIVIRYVFITLRSAYRTVGSSSGVYKIKPLYNRLTIGCPSHDRRLLLVARKAAGEGAEG